MSLHDHLQLYLSLGLTPVPPKFRCKQPLVRCGNGCNPAREELMQWSLTTNLNGFDSDLAFRNFAATHNVLPRCPLVKTGRGYHIWLRPRKPVPSQRIGDVEIKCLGSYIVAPPSIHPNGARYVFLVAPDGALPKVDLEAWLCPSVDKAASLASRTNVQTAAPSDFALRYGKSQYPESLCGLATMILTSPDGRVKKLVSLRCWKWHCPKCAPLLKRYWQRKLERLPIRFILRLPSVDKPRRFLQRLGKPRYVHILANAESWLFLMDGNLEQVWAEAQRHGYALVAEDASGDPTAEDVAECLREALCREDTSLNTRRKITHSRSLLRKGAGGKREDESKRQTDCGEETKDVDMSAVSNKNPQGWNSKVVMKPIRDVARELEEQGWHLIWKSEVEALAVRGETLHTQAIDIVELLESLGVKLKRAGKEYVGLCPFHDDHSPSLSVKREKGVWKCHSTRCGKAGSAEQFVKEWRATEAHGDEQGRREHISPQESRQ